MAVVGEGKKSGLTRRVEIPAASADLLSEEPSAAEAQPTIVLTTWASSRPASVR